MKQTTQPAKSPGAASKKKVPGRAGKAPAHPESHTVSHTTHGHHGPEGPGPWSPIPEIPGKPGRDVPEIPGKQAPDGPFPGSERPEGDEMIFRGSQDEVEDARAARGGLEGEGSYEAARRYRAGLARSVQKGDSEKLAEKAAHALDSPEGAALREAEREAKGGHPGRKASS